MTESEISAKVRNANAILPNQFSTFYECDWNENEKCFVYQFGSDSAEQSNRLVHVHYALRPIRLLMYRLALVHGFNRRAHIFNSFAHASAISTRFGTVHAEVSTPASIAGVHRMDVWFFTKL